MSRPEPNFQTVATLEQVINWAKSVECGSWSWVRNSRCKYVTISIDTRHGAFALQDRDGKRIGLDDLTRQFGREGCAGASVEPPR